MHPLSRTHSSALRQGVFLAVLLTAVSAVAQTAGIQNMPATPSTELLATGPAGVVITATDIRAELQRAPEESRKAILAQSATLQQLVSNLLVRRVLAAEADRDGLGADVLSKAAVNIARDRILSDARLARLDAQNEPSAAALDAYAREIYKANQAKFEKPAQTRARHILLPNSGPDSLKKANNLLGRLRTGESFEELAKANSTDAGSAARGGDLGFFAAGKMVRPFEDAVSKLAKPGDLSEPVESQFGYHIIRLEERTEKGFLAYDEVRIQLLAEARTALMNESRVTKVQSLYKDFKFESANIEALSKQTNP